MREIGRVCVGGREAVVFVALTEEGEQYVLEKAKA
jgi:hypothetical protein